MNAYEKIREAINRECPNGGSDALDDALAALAELERAAAEPVAWMWNDMLGIPQVYASQKRPTWPDAGSSPAMAVAINVRPLYTAPPPAPVAEMREPTPEECERIARESTVMMATSSTYEQIGRAMFDAVRAVMRETK